jgi:hypothetical protein
MLTRMAVLRLDNARTLVAKQPESPVVLILVLEMDLSAEQMRRLCVATPYEPVMVMAKVSDKWDGRGFHAEIVEIEVLCRSELRVKQTRSARAGLVKRRRGGDLIEFD